VGVEDAVSDVVAECADVADVVVEAFHRQKQVPDPVCLGGHLDAEGVLDSAAVGQAVADGGIAGDPLRQRDAIGGLAAFEELLDSFVDVPESGFEPDDGFADDGEAEVAGLDQAGMDGPDRNLVDAGAFHVDEREGLVGLAERWRGPGVVTHRMPALRPMAMADQLAWLRVAGRADAIQVLHFAFEAAGGVGQGG
jgi:hypothetical protein